FLCKRMTSNRLFYPISSLVFFHNLAFSHWLMAGRAYRTLNALMAGYSFMLGAATHRSFSTPMPVAVSAELTNHCILQCPECPTGSGTLTREKGFMDVELFKKIISEAGPYLYYINLYFQGEPMLHPGFFSFIALAGKIRTIVSTNGHFLSVENSQKLARSGLYKLIVSLDGMDQRSYSSYRVGGDLEKVLEGLKNISSAIKTNNSSLKLEIQYLVNNKTEMGIEPGRKFARDINASFRLKSMQVSAISRAGEWMPVNKRFRRYEKINGNYSIKSSLPDRCLRLVLNPVITWDGKVIPCCFDKDARYVMGDLARESFRSIWHGALYSDFRERILTERSNTDICRNCTSGLRGVIY
ncbi:MAG: radical SAM/SPASM domain-containing protein, partial [Bacteroidales bacterium]